MSIQSRWANGLRAYITCLLCGGKGFTVTSSMGTPQPIRCRACGGTGKQKIAS